MLQVDDCRGGIGYGTGRERRCHDVRNARLEMEQDRHKDGRTLADEDGFQCRTNRLRERLPTGVEEARAEWQGEECV
jgi:hypothetical protein